MKLNEFTKQYLEPTARQHARLILFLANLAEYGPAKTRKDAELLYAAADRMVHRFDSPDKPPLPHSCVLRRTDI
jgi:Mn-dependent DtxR family transcriptional regulator